MGILDTIIAIRKTEYNKDNLDIVLGEVLTYFKLTRTRELDILSDRAKKRCPNLHALATGDLKNALLLNIAFQMIAHIDYDYVKLQNDILTDHANKILNSLQRENITQDTFYNYEMLRDRLDETNAVTIETDINDEEIKIITSISVKDTEKIIIFVGEYDKKLSFDNRMAIQPYIKQQNEDKLEIKTFSSQGNNDYTFGKYNSKPLSMPDNKQLNVGEMTVKLTKAEQIAIIENTNDIGKLANTLYNIIKRGEAENESKQRVTKNVERHIKNRK